MDYNELYHHGVKGQRWGVIRTKEQLGYKTLNKKTISDGTKGTGQKTRLGRLFSKSKSSAKNEETKEEYEARKNRALKVGTASEILKFKGDLTNQQMQTAITRINLEKQLSDISSRETKKARNKVYSTIDKIDKITSGVGKGIRVYNTGARIYNSVNKNGYKLPKI